MHMHMSMVKGPHACVCGGGASRMRVLELVEFKGQAQALLFFVWFFQDKISLCSHWLVWSSLCKLARARYGGARL